MRSAARAVPLSIEAPALVYMRPTAVVAVKVGCWVGWGAGRSQGNNAASVASHARLARCSCQAVQENNMQSGVIPPQRRACVGQGISGQWRGAHT